MRVDFTTRKKWYQKINQAQESWCWETYLKTNHNSLTGNFLMQEYLQMKNMKICSTRWCYDAKMSFILSWICNKYSSNLSCMKNYENDKRAFVGATILKEDAVLSKPFCFVLLDTDCLWKWGALTGTIHGKMLYSYCEMVLETNL